jgi:hypothetical protein
MIHAKGLTVIGLFGIFATMSNAAAAPVGAGTAAVQRVAPSDVVLVQDRTLQPRRVRAQRNIAQPYAMSETPILTAPLVYAYAGAFGAVAPLGTTDLYQQGDRCRYIYPCSMSNTLD